MILVQEIIRRIVGKCSGWKTEPAGARAPRRQISAEIGDHLDSVCGKAQQLDNALSGELRRDDNAFGEIADGPVTVATPAVLHSRKVAGEEPLLDVRKKENRALRRGNRIQMCTGEIDDITVPGDRLKVGVLLEKPVFDPRPEGKLLHGSKCRFGAKNPER